MKIYGPVPSWRLGNSLGVDLVEAPEGYSKICSFDCLYCQLGHNGFKTNKPKKIDINEDDFEALRQRIKETNPDYITFSGEGEPTLNLNLGYVARRIKQMTNIPLAVLTNASFLDDPDVRNSLDYCDLVLVKLDAPNQKLFERINQPYGNFALIDVIEGIKMLNTNVVIQTLLFSYNGLTNADNKTIKEMITIYNDINAHIPISIFLGTAYRPGDLDEVRPISGDRIEQIASQITKETGIKVKYYQKEKPKQIIRHLDLDELEKEVLELLIRRPCTEEDISTRFGGVNISQLLSHLVKKGKLKERYKNQRKFYFIN